MTATDTKGFKTIYRVEAISEGRKFTNVFLPKEFYLCKSILNEGAEITNIKKEKISPQEYEFYFGKQF